MASANGISVELTAGNDVITGDEFDNLIFGTSTTLNAGDSLDGGGGTDTLRLALLANNEYIRLDQLSAFSGIEKLDFLNFSSNSYVELSLRDGADLTVTLLGAGFADIKLSTGSETIIGGSGLNYFRISRAAELTTGDSLDGGGGYDTLLFQGFTGTFDLTPISLQQISRLWVAQSGLTVQVNDAVIAGMTYLDGFTGAMVSTTASSLDLRGKSVSVAVASENEAGTIFLVDSVATAFRVQGGAGADTIDASTLTLTPEQRETIFAVSSVETIIDASGTYAAPVDAIVGTDGDDVLSGTSGADTILGGLGNDMLSGADGDDLLDGGADNDRIFGGAGQDTLIGGPGRDVADYGGAPSAVTVSLALAGPQDTIGAGVDTLSGFEDLWGSSFDDVLTGDEAGNEIVALAGSDALNGAGGNDILRGGSGNDALNGGDGVDFASFVDSATGVTVNLFAVDSQDTADGIDTLTAIEGLWGSRFDDVLTGDDGSNILIGDPGDDILQGGLGNDVLDGRTGIDTASYADATGGVTVTLALFTQDTGGAGVDSLAEIENLTGSVFNDTLTGDGGANVLIGGAGNDDFDGGAGNDDLDGGEGNDRFTGGLGDDTLVGGFGNDTFFADLGDDILIGGADSDIADYTQAAGSVVIDLSLSGAQDTGSMGLDTFLEIESVFGSFFFADVLTGDSGNNQLLGFGGDDALDGAAGSDILRGGGGNDTLNGGDGDDLASFVDSSVGVTVSLAVAGPQNTGDGIDTLVAIEGLGGSFFDDVLIGDAGNNGLVGEDGNDLLQGGLGDDNLIGRAGIDTASYTDATSGVAVSLTLWTQDTGGAGIDSLAEVENLTGSAFNDTLTGDGGINVLAGGAGSDTLDGQAGNDTLDGGLGDIDTARFWDVRAKYTITENADGSWQVAHTGFNPANALGRVSDGIDTLLNIEQAQFADQVFSLINDAPVVTSGMADQSATEDEAFLFAVPAETFADVDGDVLTYTATLASGDPLPAWLLFDPATRTFSGTPLNGDVGSIDVRVTASDGSLSVSDVLALAVAPDAGPALISFGATPTGVALIPIDASDILIPTPTATAETWSIGSSAALADNGFVVAWQSRAVSSSGLERWSIFAQTFDPSGQPVSGQIRVDATSVDTDKGISSVIALADGGFLVLFNSWYQDGSEGGVFARRFSASGAAVGSEFQVNTLAAGEQSHATAAAFADGGFIVAWSSEVEGAPGYNMAAQRYDLNGNPIGGEFVVNSTVVNASSAVGYQRSPGIAVLQSGDFVLSWTSQDQDQAGVYCQLYSPDGARIGNAFRIPSETVGYQSHPSVSALMGGGFVVTWAANGQDGSGWSIYAQRFDASGSPIGVEALVNSYTAGEQNYPASTALPDGGYAISWSSFGQDGSSWGVYAQRFDASGTPVGDEVRLNATTSGAEFHENYANGSLVTTPSGDILQTFYGVIQQGGDGEVYVRRFEAPDALIGHEDASVSLPLIVAPTEAGEAVTQVVLSDLPPGSILSAGTSNSDGTVWTFDGSPPSDLTLTPPVNYNGVFTLTVTATTQQGVDTATTSATKIVTIVAVNDAPVLASALADQSATEDEAFSFTVPADTFADVDGDALTYAATLANGDPLPSWLSFNAATRTFSGTPLNGDVGALSVRVSATDPGGLSVSDVFELAIAAETIAPTAIVTDDVAGVATGNVTYQIAFSEPVTGLAADDFTVTNGSVVSVSGTGQSYSVIVAPTAGFEGSLALSLNAAAVLDKSGNANAAVNADAQLVDTRKPVVTTITPAADSTGVVVAANIGLTYSEAVRAGAGVIELRTAAGTLVESFDVATSNRLVFAGSTITIDPTASLGGATQYRLTVPEGAVLDAAGNAAAALATYAFTTQSLVNIINGTSVANTLNGTAEDDEIYGFGGNDTLNGNAGNDLLDGGSGADRMTGGAGDDIYVVDSGNDVVIEAVNGGIDLVRTSRATYTLASNFENLAYTGDANFTGTGNAAANNIAGGIGNDRLDGRAGNDIMAGGAGNDQYVVDSVGDLVVELASQGTDAVTSSVSYTLGANIENLTLSGSAGLSGAGNASANQITGNSGANTLRGAGGADALNGGGGTDTAVFDQAAASYALDHTGSAVIVSDLVGGEGTDTLTSIETLSFAGERYAIVNGGGAANTLNGGAGSQAIFALGGNDTINGGAGNDIIIAGLGNDAITLASDNGGRDFIDGGAGEDTFTLATAAGAEAFVIYTRAEALQAVAGLALNPNTEIVITRNGLVIAELDNVEEIVVSSLRVTSPAGANGGTVSGDTIQVVGDFNQTSLNFNTITINGTQANDVVDISALASAHRIVFTSNGGQDTVIGSLRPQDIVNMGPAASSSAARDGSGPLSRGAPAGDAIEVSRDLPGFGMSDGIEAMTGVRSDLRELAMAGPRNEVAGRTMIDMDDLLLDLVDAGPVASADIAMPIVIDTDSFFDHRPVLTDYVVS